MGEYQKSILDQQLRLQRGAAIIEGTQNQFRKDGYTNLLNKYGTKQDNSTAYQYSQEEITDDLELTRLYEGNGLFAKIIDRPSEEAVKHGLDIDYGDERISEYVEARMDELAFEDKFATAEKWARLYGGSILVMLVDDGRGLEEPIDWQNVKSIEELRVFERAVVQPDYTSLQSFHFLDTAERKKAFGEPEYYQVSSLYGYFTIHRSRCLVFRNGHLPEKTSNAIYRYWGIPEYVKIKRALRECITSHENGVKLLERSVQAIYKMRNLANLLSTADGEDKVLRRLEIIDMARGILNSIAIDTDGEEYGFETLPLSGVKDILDSTCNMLSAVTNIPQTILFGRSPAGMNSTGDSDMENFYNMVEGIQKQNMKKNVRTIIDLILQQGKIEGKITELPKYKVKFSALWSMSDTEKAAVDQTKAQTKYTKAQTAQLYMDSNVLDPSEVRSSLTSEGDFEIKEIFTESNPELELPEDTFDLGSETIRITETKGKTDIQEENIINITNIEEKMDAKKENIHFKDFKGQEDYNGRLIQIIRKTEEEISDEAKISAAAVLILMNGKILCALRSNGEGICGPGGHIEKNETPEEAVIREAQEEFHITPINLLPLGEYKASSKQYLSSKLYFTDQFLGIPEADGEEMIHAQWLTLKELQQKQLFPPFAESIKMLINLLTASDSNVTITLEMDGGTGSGNFGHGGRPGKLGGSSEGSEQKVDYKAAREYTKVLKGVKTVGGTIISKVTGHAAYRMKERGYSTDDVKEAVTGAGIQYPGNKKNPNAECYQYKGSRIIVSSDGAIISVIRLEESK